MTHDEPMAHDDIDTRLRAILTDMTGEDCANLPAKTLLQADLKLDSLDVVELDMAIEEEFMIEMDPEWSGDMTISALRDIVVALLPAALETKGAA